MTVLITRHGESLHNLNSSFWQEWQLCDAMGLTEKGVRQAFEKAEQILPEARTQKYTVLVPSTTVRANQTAKIIWHYLKKHKISASVSAPRPDFTEVPDLTHAFPAGFDYNKFRVDPFYTEGGSERIVDRIALYVSEQTYKMEDPQGLRLIVSHNYAIQSLLTAKEFESRTEPIPFAELSQKFLEMNRTISHEELIKLS